jgi:hypothetical protein
MSLVLSPILPIGPINPAGESSGRADWYFTVAKRALAIPLVNSRR